MSADTLSLGWNPKFMPSASSILMVDSVSHIIEVDDGREIVKKDAKASPVPTLAYPSNIRPRCVRQYDRLVDGE